MEQYNRIMLGKGGIYADLPERKLYWKQILSNDKRNDNWFGSRYPLKKTLALTSNIELYRYKINFKLHKGM